MNNTVLEFECIGMDGGSKFPIEYTGRGQDISPEFIIKNLSPNAKTLAVTLEDLSHPIKDFTHWIIWNIPAADCEINISANSMKRNFLKKAEKHIIQKGSIIGEFE